MNKAEKAKNLKEAKTFKEQIEILRSRGMSISNEQWALSILERINYYRLSAYMLTYKVEDKFIEGISIEMIYNLYEFDRKLRSLIMRELEEIEIAFRAQIAYFIAHTYGTMGYLELSNFKDAEIHTNILTKLEEEINRSKEVFIEHYISNYNGVFPVWVAIEVISFGTLSKIFSNMKDQDQDIITNKYYKVKGEYVKSWLHSLSALRNVCAHNGRIYNKRLDIGPKLFKAEKNKGIRSNTLFAAIFVIKKLLLNNFEWTDFLKDLNTLIKNYEIVDIKKIGFTNDWEDILR